jgi:RND family efflux transporter MFP subunit
MEDQRKIPSDERQPHAGAAESDAVDRRRGLVFKVGVPVAVVLGGVLAATLLLKTAPQAERTAPEKSAQLIDAVEVRVVDAKVRLTAMGPVDAARTVELRSEVRGEIVSLSEEVIPGGLFEAGGLVAEIDPRDYALAVTRRKSEVAAAERELKLEMGQQSVARREFELLGEVLDEDDRELVLRVPQLAAAQRNLDSAKAALEEARIDLEKTKIFSPFNAIVRSKKVDAGDIVSDMTVLATLVDTDEYWVEVAVPVDQLRWIDIPKRPGDPASRVRVFNESAWGEKVWREGHVLRLAADLEAEGRMSKLIVAVDDPMSLEPENAEVPILLIGSYVRVEIEGRNVESVISLPRDLVRRGDVVWVLRDDDTLALRPVTIRYRGRDHVLVSDGLEEGDRVISTDIAAPVEGMPLRLGTLHSSDSGADAAIETRPPAERKSGNAGVSAEPKDAV